MILNLLSSSTTAPVLAEELVTGQVEVPKKRYM